MRSIIIADDVRQEINGKEIFIGVYNFSIVFSSFPAFVPKLVLKLTFDLLDEKDKRFHMELKDPNGGGVAKYDGEMPSPRSKGEPISLGFIIGPIQIYVEGRYTIELGVGGESPEVISDMYVRSPRNDEERSRLHSLFPA